MTINTLKTMYEDEEKPQEVIIIFINIHIIINIKKSKLCLN